MIVAANHVRNRHLDVVGHDGEVIGGLTVRSEDDEILDLSALNLDDPVDQVVESHRALGDSHPNGARRVRALAGVDFLGCKSGTSPVVEPPATGPLGRLPLGFQFVGSAVAVVRSTRSHQLLRHRTMALEALRLKVRAVRSANLGPFVPVDAEPAETVEDAFDHFRGRSFGVGVLDSQHEHAALTTGEEPVEEGGACAADVKVAGRRRGESDARRGHDAIVILARQPAEAERGAWV